MHWGCANITSVEAKILKDFTCEACLVKKKKERTESHGETPLRRTKGDGEIFKLIREELKAVEERIVEKLNASYNSINVKLEEFSKSMDFFSGKIDEYENLARNVVNRVNEIEQVNGKLNTENQRLKVELASLKADVNDLQQRSRSCNIEIVGVPETKGEDAESIIKRIAQVIDLSPGEAGTIQKAHRVPRRKGSRNSPIIAQLQSRYHKDLWMQQAKKYRERLRNSALHNSFNNDRFYINNHLSSYNKQLLHLAKTLIKSHEYKYAWEKDAKIFVRKSVGANAIRINSIDDIEKLQGKGNIQDLDKFKTKNTDNKGRSS